MMACCLNEEYLVFVSSFSELSFVDLFICVMKIHFIMQIAFEFCKEEK